MLEEKAKKLFDKYDTFSKEKMLLDEMDEMNYYSIQLLEEESDREIILRAFTKNCPVFLWGGDIYEKLSRLEVFDSDCEIAYLDEETYESLIGLTEKEKNVCPTWYLRIKEKCENEPDKMHLLFFTQLLKAQYLVKNGINNLVLLKRLQCELPVNVRIVVTGCSKDDLLTEDEKTELKKKNLSQEVVARKMVRKA